MFRLQGKTESWPTRAIDFLALGLASSAAFSPNCYRDTCAETASHLPFCRAQQSV
jgi:hypothetical protein